MFFVNNKNNINQRNIINTDKNVYIINKNSNICYQFNTIYSLSLLSLLLSLETFV